MFEPRLDVPGPWIAAGKNSELWRRFGTEFQQLHKAEVDLLNGQKEDRRFRALVGFTDPAFPFGRWQIYSCIDELIKSQFTDLATRIGIALDAPKDIPPLDYWLYHVWVVLRWKAPGALYLASDEGGFILDILEGSAICCAVYAGEVSEYFHSCCRAADDAAPSEIVPPGTTESERTTSTERPVSKRRKPRDTERAAARNAFMARFLAVRTGSAIATQSAIQSSSCIGGLVAKRSFPPRTETNLLQT